MTRNVFGWFVNPNETVYYIKRQHSRFTTTFVNTSQEGILLPREAYTDETTHVDSPAAASDVHFRPERQLSPTNELSFETSIHRSSGHWGTVVGGSVIMLTINNTPTDSEGTATVTWPLPLPIPLPANTPHTQRQPVSTPRRSRMHTCHHLHLWRHHDHALDMLIKYSQTGAPTDTHSILGKTRPAMWLIGYYARQLTVHSVQPCVNATHAVWTNV